jgi:hypothetical protein
VNRIPRKHKQIAIVLRDIERTLEDYIGMLGIGPWNVRRFTPHTVRDFHVYGHSITENFKFEITVCCEGKLEWELIQPACGPNIDWQHLEVYGEGQHHVKEFVPNEPIPAVLTEFAARGCRVLQTDWIDGDVLYSLGTERLPGFVYEIGKGGPISPAERQYP